MLHILIRSSRTDGAIPAVEVVEIVPLVALQSEPGSPACVLGTMEYRGQALRVVDFGLLLAEAPCAHLYSTRILILQSPQGQIGLLAQGVSDALDIKPLDLLSESASSGEGNYRLARTPHGTLRVFHTLDLLQLLAPRDGAQS